jgi:hypothetical protein
MNKRMKTIAGALLSAGVALAGVGLADGTAHACPAVRCRSAPGPDVRRTTRQARATGAPGIRRCRQETFG